MVGFEEIKDENNEIIGASFLIVERESDIRGPRQVYNKIVIEYGEIVDAKITGVGYHHLDEDEKVADIENWNVVEKVLKFFLEKYPNDFKHIFSKLKANSNGYKIAEEIIDSEINKLEEQAKTLKLMKRR